MLPDFEQKTKIYYRDRKLKSQSLKWVLKMSGQLAVSVLFKLILAGQHMEFKSMKNQSEQDRVDLRVVQTKLREMTKDRDNFKAKFIETFDQLNETENNLVETRYQYDEILMRFTKLSQEFEKATMLSEDYRSVLFNYDEKFKRLTAWEKELRELEKELRSIKRRENPYEYVDFSDKSMQTSNPTKDKGMNTDQMMIAIPTRNPK
jgi:chromosome segregation ATPase